MSRSNKLTKLGFCSLAAALCGVGNLASAHTVVIMPGSRVLEGYEAKAAYRMVHACDESGLPVIAQSFVLPTVNPVLSRSGGGHLQDTNGDGKVDLADIIEQGSLVGLIQPYIDSSVFKQRQRKEDSLGNAIGFSSRQGQLPGGFFGEIPFMLPPAYFVTNSCVTHLVVHPVGADICKISNPPQLGDANLWIEHPTAKFPNPTVHGVGENALRIDYTRDLKNNPLLKRCGKGYSVDVFASDEDIDTNLPIPKYWP